MKGNVSAAAQRPQENLIDFHLNSHCKCTGMCLGQPTSPQQNLMDIFL